jgi:hypothetical protein
MARTLLVVLLLAVISFAEPLFNICAWKDAEPELYKNYGPVDCPPLWRLQPDGKNCEEYRPDKQMCASFCQLRTMFFYGREEPYLSDFCKPNGQPCHLPNSRIAGFDFEARTNAKFYGPTLELGVSILRIISRIII